MLSSPPCEHVHLDANDKDIESIVSKLVINSFAQHWIESKSSIKVKKQTDGLSNVLFAVRSSDQDGVMVKIFGKNPDLIVDRQAEIRFMLHLAQYQMSPSILLTFDNGFIYQYALGEPLEPENKKKSTIARKLAKLHSMPQLDENASGQLVEKLRHYINFFNGLNDDLSKRIDQSSQRFIKEIDWSQLTKDIDQIQTVLEHPQGPWTKIAVVMCHNDTQSLNFLYDKKTEAEISMIDFEHCARNMWLVDVFNHFIEYAGVQKKTPDFKKDYPRQKEQKQWLEVYLDHASFLNGKPEKQMTLDELCDLGDCLRAPIHLYWSLWAFLQALLNIDAQDEFDYVQYGKCRLKEYEKYKNDFFSTVKQ